MDPGPANIGIAKGVKAMSFRFCTSFCTFLFIPLVLLNFPESKEKPELTIINPPPIRKASMLIPKKSNTYCPMKKEMIKIRNTLIAVHREIRERSFLSSSKVKPTKIGTVPIGLITENKAAKM